MKNKVGILGGGQLARMLALKAPALGIKPFALSPDPEDPAAQVTGFWKRGSPLNTKSLANFLNEVDVLTFESEFIPVNRIKKALKKCPSPPLIAPSLNCLALLQDRLTQKTLLKKHRLKTADFEDFSEMSDRREKLRLLLKSKGPLVVKTRRNGYDGYGTFFIKNKDFKTPPARPCIAEVHIPFQRELALTSARNRRGDIIFLPLVETRQENGRCLWVRGPVSHKQLIPLKRKISLFLKKIKYEGIITFELFDTGTDLLINETAPRVHNSAHHSLNSLTEDQFTLHLKAIFNFPLKNPKTLTGGFAMLNLLGEGVKKPRWKLITNAHFHWYGKNLSRKGRKMGHINTLNTNPLSALKSALRKRKHFKV